MRVEMLGKNSAFVFPGQGAQYVGMGKGLCERFAASRKIFDQANEILGFDLKALCFTGPQEKLTATENCQPAILTTSIAGLEAIRESGIKIKVSHCAGLSLGEYSALVAAGSMKFSDAVMIARERGKFMEEASQENPGQMISIIGLNLAEVENICRETGAEVANLNCPGQVVVSAKQEIIDRVKSLSEQKGAKRAIVLDVSGAFHSSLMAGAAAKLAAKLEKVDLNEPGVEFVANVSAACIDAPNEIKSALVRQVSHTTYWEESIKLMCQSGVEVFYEIGPGKVLKGLIRRINPDAKVINIDNPEDIDKIS